jgi:uncharacterized alpha-E superfamily protein
MLSRVAETIYWMNRYIERAENYARFMDVNFNLSLELPPDVSEQWKPLVVATGDWALYKSLYEKPEKGKVIFFLGFDEKNPNSIYSCILKARENARSIRPDITVEVWEQINSLYYLVKDGLSKKVWQREDPRDYFNEVKIGCQLLYGIFDGTISRNDGWHFGKIGQLLERADKTSRVLDVKYHIILPSIDAVGSPIDLIQWAALLKSVSAYDMYRKQIGKLTPHNIVEFLILDKLFPRSILSCLINAEKSIHLISGKDRMHSINTEKNVGMLRSSIEYSNMDDIFKVGMHEYLDGIQLKLNDVSISIFDTYFSTEDVEQKK